MKKSVLLVLLLPVIFALTYVSCGSTPVEEPEEPPRVEAQIPAVIPPPQTGTGTSYELPGSLITRVEDARKRAMDFESPSYFPSDWEAVESQYTAVSNTRITSENELQQATSQINSILDTYDGLFKKTIPLYAQAREDEIMSVRDELIGTGLTRYYPEYLKYADDIALSALDQYEAEDYYTSRDTAKDALSEYEAYLLAARVYLRRQEIIDRGFDVYDLENFNKADEVALTAIDNYEAGDREAAVESAEESMLRYNLVLTNGWGTYADNRRAFASFEREMALANRVNIAVRDSFREADAVYNRAEESFRAKTYDEAAILFIESEALFILARQETEMRRQRAIEIIRIAEERIEESNEAAIEAERIIEGGSR